MRKDYKEWVCGGLPIRSESDGGFTHVGWRLSMFLKVLHLSLVLLRFVERRKGAEVTSLAG
jgi:hypothetical protein